MKWLKPFFSYSKNERRGIILLIVLILIVFGLRLYLPVIISNSQNSDIIIRAIPLAVEENRTKDQNGHLKLNLRKKNVNKAEQFRGKLDPNNATEKELTDAGFSEYIASNIIKYRQKGGRFLRSEDLYSIYGIDSSFHELITKIIVIDEKNTAQSLPYETRNYKIELNRADTTALKKIPGIGSVLSNRIVKYKNMIGGYYSAEQLKEVYGISDSLYIKINDYVYIGKDCCRKINLNNASENTLIAHPYINKYKAKAIIKYRKLMGNLKSVDELLESNIFNNSEYQIIKHYLSVD